MFGLNRLGLALAGLTATSGVAFAQGQDTTITDSGWVAIGIIAVLVLLILVLIRGSLSISSSRKSRDDNDMVGVLEGVDEDDESRRD